MDGCGWLRCKQRTKDRNYTGDYTISMNAKDKIEYVWVAAQQMKTRKAQGTQGEAVTTINSVATIVGKKDEHVIIGYIALCHG